MKSNLGGGSRVVFYGAATALLLFLVVLGLAITPIIVLAEQIQPAGNLTNQSKTKVVQNENLTAVASPATKR